MELVINYHGDESFVNTCAHETLVKTPRARGKPVVAAWPHTYGCTALGDGRAQDTRTCHTLCTHTHPARGCLTGALQTFSKRFTNSSLIDDIFLLKAQPAQPDFITGVNNAECV